MAFDRSVRSWSTLFLFSLSRLRRVPNDMRERETRDRREGPSSSSDGETERRPEGWRGSTEGRAEEKSRRKKGGRKGEKKRSGSFTSVRIKRSSASIIINQDVNNEGTDGSESGRELAMEGIRAASRSNPYAPFAASLRSAVDMRLYASRREPHRTAPRRTPAVRGS